jgi:hypothetical protein
MNTQRRTVDLSASISLTAAALLVLSVQGTAAQSVVHGSVLEDATEQPISVVELRLIDSAGVMQARAFSDEQGRFRMQIAASGAYSLTAIRLGYATVDAQGLQLEADDEVELEVRLAPHAVVIESVAVVAQRSVAGGWWGEFHQRAERSRRAGRGRIYLRDDIDRIRPVSVRELIDRHAWGVRCQPHILLNGIPTDDLLFGVSVDLVEGLELYRARDPIPAEYYRSDMCGLALLWTRSDPGARPLSWRRVAVAGLLVAVMGLLAR